MSATLRERATGYLHDAATGIRRAPAEVAATIALAVALSVAIEIGGDTMQSWIETAVAGLLILSLAWTGTLLHETGAWSARRRWLLTVGGALVVAVYALRLGRFEYEAEGWRAFLLVGAAVLWLFALPAFVSRSGDPVDRMRLVDGRILLRIIGALLYCGALFAGLALALAAVDSLFELDLEGEIYGHVAGWIFVVLAPWIVLGGLPDYVRPAETPSAVAAVARRIALFLVPPLLGLYCLILYAYVIRILITSELPKNLVSPLVLAAGILGILALLLFDPAPDGKPLSRALRLAPPLFLPLGALGLYAVFVRLDQYGLTEFRVIRIVVLVALLALALGATVAIVRRIRLPLHWALLGLAGAALLTAVGPWSALALSQRSQMARLTHALEAVGIDPHDETYRAPAAADTARRIVPAEHFEQIRSGSQYLATHFGPDVLPAALWHLARTDDARWKDYATELGLRPDKLPDDPRYARGGTLDAGVPVPFAGGTAYRVTWHGAPAGRNAMSAGPSPEGRSAVVTFADSSRLALRVDDRVLLADIAGMLAALPAGPGRGTAIDPARAVAPLTDTAGARVGELILWSVWLHSDSTGQHVGSLEGIAILPR